MKVYKVGVILGIVIILFSSVISQLFLVSTNLIFEMFKIYISDIMEININISIVILGMLMVWYNITEIRRYNTY